MLVTISWLHMRKFVRFPFWFMTNKDWLYKKVKEILFHQKNVKENKYNSFIFGKNMKPIDEIV